MDSKYLLPQAWTRLHENMNKFFSDMKTEREKNPQTNDFAKLLDT